MVRSVNIAIAGVTLTIGGDFGLNTIEVHCFVCFVQ